MDKRPRSEAQKASFLKARAKLMEKRTMKPKKVDTMIDESTESKPPKAPRKMKTEKNPVSEKNPVVEDLERMIEKYK